MCSDGLSHCVTSLELAGVLITLELESKYLLRETFKPHMGLLLTKLLSYFFLFLVEPCFREMY